VDTFPRIAALIGDPARSRMLTALMSGAALTATELALEADVAPSTASTHLAKLTGAHILAIEKQGRHRYFRLANEEIAEVLESLMSIATSRVRVGPSDPALRVARVCYDHLAGERGVWMLDRLRERRLLTHDVSPAGHEFFTRFGIDVDALSRARRVLCRTCLDWSERRHHLAGALGAALLQRIFALGWARREIDSRVVVFSEKGDLVFRAQFE